MPRQLILACVLCWLAIACSDERRTPAGTAPGTGSGFSPPVANDDSAAVQSTATVWISVLSNDGADPELTLDPGTVQIGLSPSFGFAEVAQDGRVYYVAPTTSNPLVDSLTYSVRDSAGQLSNTATVTIQIEPDGGGQACGGSCSNPLQGGEGCANALGIIGGGCLSFDSSAAASSGAGCAPSRDLWWEWTAETSGNVTLNTCGSSFDTILAVYAATGGCSLSNLLGCNDDTHGLQSEVTFNAQAGQAYLFQVGSFPGTPGGQGVLRLTGCTGSDCGGNVIDGGPGCALAPLITGYGCFDYFLFGGDSTPGTCAGVRDQWWEWEAPLSGIVRVTTSGSTFDTTLAVYSTSGGSCGTLLDCNDDACGLQSAVQFSAVGGGTYYIQAGQGSTGDVGTGTVHITAAALPGETEIGPHIRATSSALAPGEASHLTVEESAGQARLQSR